MAKLKLSKNSLQQQQQQLKLYKRLLPSLDLKRRQLTVESQKARVEHTASLTAAEALDAQIGRELPMLADENLDFTGLVQMTGYRVGEQNVVGTRLPILEHVEFVVADYSRLATPPWVDILVQRLKDAAEARVRSRIASERVRVLDQAVRRITQRVNLFEKILIPTAKQNIQKIRISLGDIERAAVVTSKLAKGKQQTVDSDTEQFTEEEAGAMSLVPLERVTFAGLSWERDRLLDDLHKRGCLELIPLGGKKDIAKAGTSAGAQDALKFLLSCPQRRRQVNDDSRFDAAAVERRAIELQTQIQDLEAERDDLLQRIADAKPWGDFCLPALHEVGGQRLWFYVVPRQDMPRVEASGLAWQVIRSDPRFSYVVVLAESEPQSMPVPRVHLGSRSSTELAQRLEEVELALDDAQAERASLARWSLLFAKNLARLEDAAARADAAQQTHDCDPVFALQGWAPRETTAELAEYASKNGLAFESTPPAEGDNPPTLMRNDPRAEIGEDLVNFYMTPGYWTWDPSAIVAVSFALFFAMILADAGYAAVLGVGLLLYWRRMGQSPAGRRFRPLLALIIVFSLVFGVLVGSYFGVSPPPDSPLGLLHVLDMNNSGMMMGLTILIGGAHVMLANIMDARRRADWRDGLASLGWAGAIGGGLLLAAGATMPNVAFLKPIGGVAIVCGLLLVVGFTAWREKPLPRLLQGMLGLTKISGAFGDILSYLRLFALGLASASLAIAFNDMAAGIRSAAPGIGVFLALLVLLFGHVLNLVLGISSGVIHGLRLNVIEFFNWGLKDEGRLFKPFRRKEDSLWKN